jgi:hypothetical protein
MLDKSMNSTSQPDETDVCWSVDITKVVLCNRLKKLASKFRQQYVVLLVIKKNISP